MNKGNVIQSKTFQFAKLIIKLSKELNTRKAYQLSNQIIRSGTSIGANVEEALGARSGKEFISKLSISYFEARETIYWLMLIKETEEIDLDTHISSCEEILKILTKILKTSKKRINNS